MGRGGVERKDRSTSRWEGGGEGGRKERTVNYLGGGGYLEGEGVAMKRGQLTG